MGPQVPDWAVAVGDQTSWRTDHLREDAGMRTCPREAWPPGPRLSSPGERKRNMVLANRVGVNMLQFYSVSNSLSHTTLSIKWEVYFSKELCRSLLLLCHYASAYEYTTPWPWHNVTFDAGTITNYSTKFWYRWLQYCFSGAVQYIVIFGIGDHHSITFSTVPSIVWHCWHRYYYNETQGQLFSFT